jgi:hypothetical protein
LDGSERFNIRHVIIKITIKSRTDDEKMRYNVKTIGVFKTIFHEEIKNNKNVKVMRREILKHQWHRM